MEFLMGDDNQGNVIPRNMCIQLIMGQVIEFHLSLADSHYSNVNILLVELSCSVRIDRIETGLDK